MATTMASATNQSHVDGLVRLELQLKKQLKLKLETETGAKDLLHRKRQ